MSKALQAASIGTKAGTLLRRSTTQWEVLAAVSGAIYIASRNGELVWITDRPRALHPRAILLPAMPGHAPTAGSVLRDVHGLLCCEGFRLAWQDASTWSVGGPSSAHRTTAVPERVARAIRQAGVLDGRRAYAGCAVARTRNDERTHLTEGAACAMEVELARYAEVLSLADTGRDVLRALREASGLIGLGEGLTPAGDDILGGYLYALRTLNDARLLRSVIDWESVTAWLHSVAHLTNAISRCLLVDHAHGDACAPLAAFIHGALEGARDVRLAKLASDVAGIGASSGRSLLQGVQAACHMGRPPRGTVRHLLPHRVGEAVGRPSRTEVARVR